MEGGSASGMIGQVSATNFCHGSFASKVSQLNRGSFYCHERKERPRGSPASLFPRSPDYESTIAAARFLKGRRQLLFGPGVESPLRTNTFTRVHDPPYRHSNPFWRQYRLLNLIFPSIFLDSLDKPEQRRTSCALASLHYSSNAVD